MTITKLNWLYLISNLQIHARRNSSIIVLVVIQNSEANLMNNNL